MAPGSDDFPLLLEELRKEYEAAFLIELLGVFVTDGPAVADRLAAAFVAANLDEMRRAAHALKNILGVVHAHDSYKLAAELSEALAAGDPRGAERMASALSRRVAGLAADASRYLAAEREASEDGRGN